MKFSEKEKDSSKILEKLLLGELLPSTKEATISKCYLSKLLQIIGSTKERRLKGGVLAKKILINKSWCRELSPSGSSFAKSS